MKYFSSDVTVKYAWEDVVAAFWRRYPNSYSRHVLSEDTFLKRCIPECGLLMMKKFTVKTNPMPKWGRRLGVNVNNVGIVEETLVDLKRKFFVSYTRNVNCMGFMTIDEKVTYEPHPDDPNSTKIRRMAWISSQMRGVSSLVEKFGLERFKHNSLNAIKGFKLVLQHFYANQNEQTGQILTGKIIGDLMSQKLEKVKKEAAKLPKGPDVL